MSYQKKALPVKAIQWTGVNVEEVKTFVRDGGSRAYMDNNGACLLTCYDGDRTAKRGWWIVIEPEGKFHTGDDKWFGENYEFVALAHGHKAVHVDPARKEDDAHAS